VGRNLGCQYTSRTPKEKRNKGDLISKGSPGALKGGAPDRNGRVDLGSNRSACDLYKKDTHRMETGKKRSEKRGINKKGKDLTELEVSMRQHEAQGSKKRSSEGHGDESDLQSIPKFHREEARCGGRPL